MEWRIECGWVMYSGNAMKDFLRHLRKTWPSVGEEQRQKCWSDTDPVPNHSHTFIYTHTCLVHCSALLQPKLCCERSEDDMAAPCCSLISTLMSRSLSFLSHCQGNCSSPNCVCVCVTFADTQIAASSLKPSVFL